MERLFPYLIVVLLVLAAAWMVVAWVLLLRLRAASSAPSMPTTNLPQPTAPWRLAGDPS